MIKFGIHEAGRQSSISDKMIGALVTVIMLSLFLFVGFYLYKILWFAVPFLLLFALLVDYKTPLRFVYDLYRGFRREPLWGLINLVIQMIFLPFGAIKLILQAWSARAIRSIRKKAQGNYVEYEEETITIEDDDVEALSDSTQRVQS